MNRSISRFALSSVLICGAFVAAAWGRGSCFLGTSYCIANPNSTGSSAFIQASGSHCLADDDVFLVASNLPPGAPGLFFFGPTQILVPFGEGFRCVGGLSSRIQPPAFANDNGHATRVLDLSTPYGQQLLQVAGFGPVNFQFWYRDPMGGPAGFNTTDAVSIQFRAGPPCCP